MTDQVFDAWKKHVDTVALSNNKKKIPIGIYVTMRSYAYHIDGVIGEYTDIVHEILRRSKCSNEQEVKIKYEKLTTLQKFNRERDVSRKQMPLIVTDLTKEYQRAYDTIDTCLYAMQCTESEYYARPSVHECITTEVLAQLVLQYMQPVIRVLTHNE